MILIDTAPIISLLNRRDPDQLKCRSALAQAPTPPHTTWPVITESMYFLHKYVGWPGQSALWQMMQRDQIVVIEPDAQTVARTFELMEKYRDTPMDLADASLVALAEKLDCKNIFTLDSNFQVYKFKNRAAFKIIPN